jgi:hypothetical protein
MPKRPGRTFTSREVAPAISLIAIAALASVAVLTPTSDAQNTGASGGTAMVRVAHLSPDTGGVDVYIDGERALQNVGYNTVSDYSGVPAGEHELELRPAGADAGSEAVLAASATFVAENAYTVAGIGLNENLRGQIFEDDLSAPAAGAAKVRVLNAAVDVEPIDVILTPSVDIPGQIAFAAATPYENVAPGMYDVSVADGNQDEVLDVPDVNVGAGIIYTFAVIGGADKPTQFVPVVDARGASVMPAGGAATGGGGAARERIP